MKIWTNKMKNESINEPIKKIKKISSIQIDSIAIEWNVCGWNKICDWAIMIEIKIKIEIELNWFRLNWIKLSWIKMFKQIYLFIYELIDIFMHSYIHSYIYNVIEVLYPRENNFALESIYIYRGNFASALYPNRVRKMEK